MPIVYQCYTCGRRHKTEQAALDCHEGPIQAIETKVKGIDHRVEMERAFLFGEPYAYATDTTTLGPRRATAPRTKPGR